MALNPVVLEEARIVVEQSSPLELSSLLLGWIQTESPLTISTLINHYSIEIWPSAYYRTVEYDKLDTFNVLHKMKSAEPYLDEVLHIALEQNNLVFIERTLALGASPNVGVVQGIKNNQLATIRKFIELGANLRDARIIRSLYVNFNLGILNYLVSKGLDLNIKVFEMRLISMDRILVSILEYTLYIKDMQKFSVLIRIGKPLPPSMEYWRFLFRRPEDMLLLLSRFDWQEVGPLIVSTMKRECCQEELKTLFAAGYYDF